MSHQYVGHLKSGPIKEPSFGKIVAISQAMGVPLEAWLKQTMENKDA